MTTFCGAAPQYFVSVIFNDPGAQSFSIGPFAYILRVGMHAPPGRPSLYAFTSSLTMSYLSVYPFADITT